MSGVEILTLTLQGLLPLALISWAARPHGTRLSWVLDVSMAAAYLIAIALAGLWLALPHALMLTFAVLLVGAAVLGTRSLGSRSDRPPSLVGRVAVGARGTVVLGLAAIVVVALAGRRCPPRPRSTSGSRCRGAST